MSKQMKLGEAFVTSLLFIVSLSGCISFGASGGSITLNDPVVAKGADQQDRPIDPTTEFKTTDKRMYVIISATGTQRIPIGYRWYFGDKLIVEDRIGLDAEGRAAIFLQSPEGGSFPAGDYRVEIYLVKTADKIVYFKVTQ